MAFNISPSSVSDVTNTILATDIASGARTVPFNLGEQKPGARTASVTSSAKANASISASTAVCTVNAATFLATASGGSYTSPATAMVTGDYGWFFAASV
jgi:hypothetical protein